MSTTKVAIAGISGRLAQLIATALLEKPNVVIHGIARTPSKVSDKIAKHERVKIFQADASAETLDTVRQAIRGTSIVICCYLGDNTVLVDGQKRLIDAAIAEKVPRFMAGDFSFDVRDLKQGDFAIKDFQIIINEYLDQKEAEGLIKPVHIYNGAFMEVIFSPFMGVYSQPDKALQIWGTGDEKLEMTTYEDSARFAAEVAVDPTANGYMRVVGDRKSIKEIRAIYEDVYGETLTLQNLGSVQDLLDKALTIQGQEPHAFMNWVGKFFLYFMVNGSTHIEGDDHARVGIAIGDLKHFFQGHPKDELPKLMPHQ